ncbi:DUF4199 domain-containing protein [Leptobacterium sp. I13]|uniref:DUF4199 domain-containing protein n=1 Tax=Leptobacterium meishanense TaxID=3128904 RepID=UPI0030EE4796
MEELQPKTGKFALTYGLLLGGIGVVFGLMLYFMDMHYQGGFSLLIVNVVIMLGVIIFGMRQFKKANGGFMSFGQALKIGVGIALIGGIIGVLYQQLVIHVLDPEFMNKAMEIQRAQLSQNSSLTPEQIDQQLEMGKKFSTPLIQVAFGLIGSLFFGFILSLIPALVMKKAKDE